MEEMKNNVHSLSEEFFSMLTTAGVACLVCLAWFIFCRWVYRIEHASWLMGISEAKEESYLPLDGRILRNHDRIIIAMNGSSADRLYFAGITYAIFVVLLVIAGHFALNYGIM